MDKKDTRPKGIFTLASVHFFNHIYILALPPLFPLLKKYFQVGNTETGLIMTVMSLSMVIFQLPFGHYSDKVGRKKILLLCLIMLIGSTFLISITTAFWMIIALQILLGIGASGYHPVGISAAAEMSPRNRVGRIMSVQGIGGTLGLAFAPIIVGSLAGVYGWRVPLQIIAAAGLPVLFFVRYSLVEKSGPLGRHGADKTGVKAAKSQKAGAEKVIITALILMQFFRALTFKGLSTFMPTYLVEIRGFSLLWAGLMAGILRLSGVLSQLIGGRLADNFSKIGILVLSNLVSAFFLFMLSQNWFKSVPIYVVIILLGLSIYISIPSTLSLIEKATRSGRYGRTFGTVFTTVEISGMVAPIILGYIGDVLSLTYSFSLLPLFLILAAASMIFVKARS